MNTYTQFTRGKYETTYNSPEFTVNTGYTGEELKNYLTSSAFYSRLHNNNSIFSVRSPSGVRIDETGSLTAIATGSLFAGGAHWDAGSQSGKNPFYDSYVDFATETRLKGKGFSTIPEFRISNHVEDYLTKGVTEELADIFELSGATSQNTTTQSESSFYKILSTSDFLKHFDLVKKDHKDLAKESIITLKCKAIKKFLPYDGFYPAQQTVDIAKEFKKAVEDDVALIYSNSAMTDNSLGIQGIMEPLFAPGVLFNTIKSGVAVDYPIVLPDDNPFYLDVDYEGDQGVNSSGANPAVSNYKVGRLNYTLAGSDLSPFQSNPGYYPKNLNSIWSKRIDFESLVEPERLLSNLEMTVQEPHPYGMRSVSGVTYKWGGQQKITYKKKINNFLAEVADTFLDNGNFTTLVSDQEDDPNFGNAEAGKYYTMRIKMYRSRNHPNLGYDSWGNSKVVPPQDQHAQGVRETFTMYSRPSAFGHDVWGTNQGGDSGRTYPLDANWGSNYCFN